MNKRFPSSLWLLPILFGVAGGLVAALIADLKFAVSWWELLLVGVVVTLLEVIIFLAVIATVSTGIF